MLAAAARKYDKQSHRTIRADGLSYGKGEVTETRYICLSGSDRESTSSDEGEVSETNMTLQMYCMLILLSLQRLQKTKWMRSPTKTKRKLTTGENPTRRTKPARGPVIFCRILVKSSL